MRKVFLALAIACFALAAKSYLDAQAVAVSDHDSAVQLATIALGALVLAIVCSVETMRYSRR